MTGEQSARIDAMIADDNDTWDLSPADVEALMVMRAELDRLRSERDQLKANEGGADTAIRYMENAVEGLEAEVERLGASHSPEQPVTWAGDLDDDCTARWGNLLAHAEAMDENAWFAAVYLDGAEEDLFHSASDDILPLSGPAARKLCELVMRAHAARGEVERLRRDAASICETASVVVQTSSPTIAADFLRARMEVEQKDVARLKAGKFTAEEIHEICHSLHGTVDARAFADGCATEQRKLYGCAPDADELAACRQRREGLAERVASQSDQLTLNAARKAGEVAALREALRPFADYAGLRGSRIPDETPVDSALANCVPPRGPTIGDCRRAAKLLEGKP